MSYINDPREMAIRPDKGVILEEDNRNEEMYHWGAMVVDLCDLPVEEYMKPMTVIGLGGGGGGELPETTYTLKFVVDGQTVVQESLKSGDPIPFSFNGEKEGRNFLGWFYGSTKYEDGALMPSKSLTLTAKYSCDVKFIFVIDDVETEVSAYTVNYNTKPTIIPNTVKPGYTFKGWEPVVTNAVTEHTTYKGIFESITYTITWNGYPSESLVQDYKYGETIIIPVAPEKEGYTFIGWDKVVPETITTNLTFNAKFEVNKYEITYHVMIDGIESDAISSTTLSYGASIPSKNVIIENGYTYSPWIGYNAETNEMFNGSKMPAHNVKYVSIRTTNEYTLRYFDNNELVKEEKYLYGAKINPFKYEKEGWTVSEWVNLPETMPYNDLDVHCESVINNYEVVFVDRENNEIFKTIVEHGTVVSSIEIVSPEGYTYTVPSDMMNVIITSDKTIMGDLTINAYQVTIINNGNTEMVMLNYGTNIEEYVKETYAPEIGYSIIVSSNYETVPANNNAVAEYYYEANLWTLYYSTNKDLNGSKVVAYNSLILPELPNTELEGYNFSGWFNGENTVTETDRMPNNDLTVNGNYVIKTFKVSVIDEDNEILSDVYEYGTKLSVITSNETVKEYLHGLEENGYVGKLNINGEELNETNVITSDLIITISKVEKEYTLIFMNGEDVISSALVKFNTTITYPVMSGYVENGVEYIFTWDDKSYDGKPMPAMDLVIKGNYKEKASAAIYFGSFKQSKSAYTPDSTTKYCDFSMLESEHYNKVNTSDYIGEGNVIQVTIIADPELQGLTAVQRNKYLKSWTQPLAILIPREIVENYSIELIDAINFNIWVNFTSDKEVVSYDGNEYYFFVNYNEETLNPVVATESMSFTLKLTKK